MAKKATRGLICSVQCDGAIHRELITRLQTRIVLHSTHYGVGRNRWKNASDSSETWNSHSKNSKPNLTHIGIAGKPLWILLKLEIVIVKITHRISCISESLGNRIPESGVCRNHWETTSDSPETRTSELQIKPSLRAKEIKDAKPLKHSKCTKVAHWNFVCCWPNVAC